MAMANHMGDAAGCAVGGAVRSADSTEESHAPSHQSAGPMMTIAAASSSATTAADSSNNNAAGATVTTASETELVLLCLDHLRDLRRSFAPQQLKRLEGLDADYITMACWALSRALLEPSQLTVSAGNDCFSVASSSSSSSVSCGGNKSYSALAGFPSLSTMERDLQLGESLVQAPETAGDFRSEKKEDGDGPVTSAPCYEYDDSARSNSHRFYPVSGLASGPALSGPLQLSEIVAAGLTGLGARSRLEAEKDMIQSPLFDQFVLAVREKGFFEDPENCQPVNEPAEREAQKRRAAAVYEERYAKVVAKFRTKLATKAETDQAQTGTGNLLALSAADQARKRRVFRLQEAAILPMADTESTSATRGAAKDDAGGGASPSLAIFAPGRFATSLQQQKEEEQQHQQSQHSPPPSYLQRTNLAQKLFFGGAQYDGNGATDKSTSGNISNIQETSNPVDLEEAEKLKAAGNTHMQHKEFEEAAACYTAALKLSPAGPSSHVYFSNRAAALVSMKKLHEAILDSERALALQPAYGKAHARLGLAHFLLGNFRQAMEAYTVALKYEPDNKSSKNYLEKAAKRLAEQQQKQQQESKQNAGTKDASRSSFSLVSEWDSKSSSGLRNQHQPSQNQHKSHQASPQQHHRQNGSALGGISYGSKVPSSSTHSGKKDKAEQRQRALDEREAEKQKVRGNGFMANRSYHEALEAYSQAVALSPSGPHSHVYYSNRAAALCYLERYQEAERDSVRSLQLNPSYGKAHARLGLSRFFLQDYAGAVEAYTSALEFDPDNAASKSYLLKAKAKLEARLLQDPALQKMAAKALRHTSSSSGGNGRSQSPATLLEDPEMRVHAAKAVADPTIMAALGGAKSACGNGSGSSGSRKGS